MCPTSRRMVRRRGARPANSRRPARLEGGPASGRAGLWSVLTNRRPPPRP